MVALLFVPIHFLTLVATLCNNLPMTHQRVVAQLRQVGYRITSQRAALLDAIWTLEGHFTVETVIAALGADAVSVDPSTIYRTLDLLCEMGELHQLVGATPTEYERVREPHHHLVCQECGKVTPLPDYHFAELVRHLAEEHGFQADLTHLAIPGRCVAC